LVILYLIVLVSSFATVQHSHILLVEGVTLGVLLIEILGVVDTDGVLLGVTLGVLLIDEAGVTEGTPEQAVTVPTIPEGPIYTAHLSDPPLCIKNIPAVAGVNVFSKLVSVYN